MLCFTACTQLVTVSTAFVFLGWGLLEKDTESQEDQYLFEICLCEHSEQICHQLAISCVPVFQTTLQHVSARIYSFVVSTLKRPVSAKYRVPRFQDAQSNKNFLMYGGQTSRRFQHTWRVPKVRPRSLSPTISCTSFPKHVYALHRKF